MGRLFAAHQKRPLKEPQLAAAQHRLAVLTKALEQADVYLPAGRAFNQAVAERHKLTRGLQGGPRVVRAPIRWSFSTAASKSS